MIRILLIEDNPGDARLLQEMLKEDKSPGMDLMRADRLGEGLELLRNNDIDVILLDLSLPDSHGLETFLATYENARNTPIILLTGLDDESIGVEALKQGAQDYLVKGKVDSDLLIRSIRYAIERQRLLVEMEEVRKHEHYLAYHDSLTRLPNRQLFYDRLQQALIQAKRYSHLVAVLFLDLDGFKEINDSKGHNVGDRLLQMVSDRLTFNVRASDTVARLGGDEFTILLHGVKNSEDAESVAQKILNAFDEPFAINENDIFITTSIGICMFPFDGNDSDSLIRSADLAMYRAKNKGKNNFQLFNASKYSNSDEPEADNSPTVVEI